jgi:hypothetical protein
MLRLTCIVANGVSLVYLLYLLVTNGFPTARQPLVIVVLVALGQVTALVLALSQGRKNGET